MIYLYIKTHNITKKKYLGQTIQNPFKYKGSGIRWLNHIKKHGYDVTTEIIFETEDKEELKEKGLYYSKLYNIVESEEWLNLIEESGECGFRGGHHSEEYKRIKSEVRKKYFEEHPEKRQEMSKIHKGNTYNLGIKRSEENKKKISETLKKLGIKPPSRKGIKCSLEIVNK